MLPFKCWNTQISCQPVETAVNFVPVFATTSNSGGKIALPIPENRWRELETPYLLPVGSARKQVRIDSFRVDPCGP